MRKIIIFLALLGLTFTPLFALSEVGVLIGKENQIFFGPQAENSLFGLKVVLENLGINYRIYSQQELLAEGLSEELLIIPNLRLMDPEAAALIKQLAESGEKKIFATYQSAYRDLKNQKAGEWNDFQLKQVFGVSFKGWISGEPFCEAILLSPEGIFPSDFPNPVFLGRNLAMEVSAAPEAVVLGSWLKAGQYPAWKPELSPAVVWNQKMNCIYVGEDLFCPENSASPKVRSLIAFLLNLLSPGMAEFKITKEIPALYFPQIQFFPPLVPGGQKIQLGILTGKEEIWLSAYSDFKMADCLKSERKLVKIKKDYPLKYFTVSALDGGVLRLFQPKPGGAYKAWDLRGALKILIKPQGVQVINELSLEEYLCGVLPNEMPAVFPLEALKAMAVTARTFARSHLSRHKGYDLCPEIHCQVYRGAGAERKECNQAVNATRAEIVCYHKRPAQITFHSVCGGIGAGQSEVWGTYDLPYLAGRPDSPYPVKELKKERNFRKFISRPPFAFCQDSPRFRWRKVYTGCELQNLFSRSLPLILNRKISLGSLKEVKVLSRNPGGRVRELLIRGASGSYIVREDSIRWLFSDGSLSTAALPSTLFYLEKKGTDYLFYGGGWGHGVGLCQQGAKGMAEASYSYLKILKHYFPGIEPGK